MDIPTKQEAQFIKLMLIYFLFLYSFLDVCYNVYAFHFLLVNKNTDDKKK